MSIVAISFTSESGDDYLSLFTNATSAEDVADRLEKEYGDEFSYLYIKCVVTDGPHNLEVIQAVQARIESAQNLEDGFYD